jgi:hypothetical protein
MDISYHKKNVIKFSLNNKKKKNKYTLKTGL